MIAPCSKCGQWIGWEDMLDPACKKCKDNGKCAHSKLDGKECHNHAEKVKKEESHEAD